MTKWFNTNYHYMVPEFVQGQQFKLTWTIDRAVFVLMTSRHVAKQQAGGQNMVVPGEIAHRQHWPRPRAHRRASGRRGNDQVVQHQLSLHGAGVRAAAANAEQGIDIDRAVFVLMTSRHVAKQQAGGQNSVDIDTLFRIGRGRAPTGEPAAAAEMTKWFNTNYHMRNRVSISTEPSLF
jgi:hypothetical protein